MFPPSPNQKKIAWPDLSGMAAWDNLTPGFFNILSKLGLEVVIVAFQAANDSPIWRHPGIERDLERALQAVQAGQFDSHRYAPGFRDRKSVV